MPRVTDHYRHLGSEVTGQVDHSALRARIEARVCTLLRMVGRLGGAQLAQLRQCLLTVVRGVLGYYGRATPLGGALGERLDVVVREQLTACGHRSRGGHVLQVIAPEKAGGMGFEPAACTAGAALCDEVARGLAGRDGEPARLALESLIALTCHRLGYEPSAACPTPLEWFPEHLESHLSEELVAEAWLLYRLRAGVGGRHSGAESQGALASAAWRVDSERASSPLIWEQLGCTFSRRLCALGIVRLADVYGGASQEGAGGGGAGAGGGAAGGDGGRGGDDGEGGEGDEGEGGGRWLDWGEVQSIYGGGGVAFTAADGREYVRLLRELDGRSRVTPRQDEPGAGTAQGLLAATAGWRAERARGQPGVDSELRMARAWRAREQAGDLPPEAVRAARRSGEGREFLVREQGALADAWWAEALLNERLGLVAGEERARLEAEAQSARVSLAPQSFSGWLEERGERSVLETAARASDSDEVSRARCELLSSFFERYVHAARRAQAGATPIAEDLGAREALRHTAPPQQSLFRGDETKDETTGKRRASLAQSQADVDAGRPHGRPQVHARRRRRATRGRWRRCSSCSTTMRRNFGVPCLARATAPTSPGRRYAQG